MQKIIGLDVGSYSIKAIEIINSFQTYEVKGFYEAPVPEIENIDPGVIAITAIKQLFSDHGLEADRIYTAMTGLYCSMRVLHLQNVKKSNVPSFVLNELEDKAPIPLEDAVVDQQIIDTKDDVTQVLAVLSKKELVEGFLNGLKELSIEPKIIDVDYLAYMNLFPFLWNDSAEEEWSGRKNSKKKSTDSAVRRKSTLVIDVGHLKTSLVLFKGNKLLTARTLRMAGRYFTEHLQRSLGISFYEAQRLKHRLSRIDVSTVNEAPKAADSFDLRAIRDLTVASVDLLREIQRTLVSFRAQERVQIDEVYLCGGSAVMQGFSETMENFLELPVRRIRYDDRRIKFSGAGWNDSMTIPQSLAIGLRCASQKEQSKINLRRGELAFVGSYDAIFQRIANVTLLVASLLVCLLASYTLRWWLYGKQIKNFKKEYRDQVVQILGQEPKNLKNMGSDPELKSYHQAAIKLIEAEIKNRQSVLDSYAARTGIEPLRVLNDVSVTIPKNVPIEVTQFSFQNNSLVMEAETDSFSNADKIFDLMKKVPRFQQVERRSQEQKPGSDGKIIKLTMSAAVKENL